MSHGTSRRPITTRVRRVGSALGARLVAGVPAERPDEADTETPRNAAAAVALEEPPALAGKPSTADAASRTASAGTTTRARTREFPKKVTGPSIDRMRTGSDRPSCLRAGVSRANSVRTQR
jgi:hypothetical protein